MASGDITLQDSWSCNEIKRNRGYLSEKITNLTSILIRLIESGIISEDERELIVSEKTHISRNDALLVLMTRKDWPNIRTTFLQILKTSGNEHCADIIEHTTSEASNFQQTNKLDSKWWPEEKFLPRAFHQRKSENVLLTKKLQEMLSLEKHGGVTVITQKVTVSGLGGIGKTTTAIWFAREYQEDYTHIIWIDCGEGSLINTFRKLAGELEVKKRPEYELKDLASKCFKILADCKCLLIFDNAECYIGNEGVKDVLPRNNKEFDILITSRNQEWGNANGDGEIPQFLLSVFDQKEGEEFMKKHVKNLPDEQKSYIGQLCNFLGNLPLALQIVVAALNRQKIVNLEKYIDKIKKYQAVVNDKFDDYEKTIDELMKISLDLIQNYESKENRNIGAIAYTIMTIFAFITPDQVPADFFIAVETRQPTAFEKIKNIFISENTAERETISKSDLDTATDLLEKYSLITRNNFVEDQYTLSIHRLLQHVIMHNEKDSKEKIIEKILNCKGFLDYKLIPFSYAEKSLQNKFKALRVELMEKLKLIRLLKEGRFTEAVEFSRIINNVLNDSASQFHFAVCLRHNLEFKQAEKELESLLKVMSGNKEQFSLPGYYSNLGIINSNQDVNKYLVRGQLLMTYFMEKKFAKARNSAIEWKKFILSLLSFNELIELTNLKSLPRGVLQFHEKQNCITFRVNDGEELTSTLELHSWVIDISTPQNRDLHHLTLVDSNILSRRSHVLAAKSITLSRTKFGKNVFESDIRSSNQFLTTEYFDFNKVEKLVFKHMQIAFNVNEKLSEADVITQHEEMFEWEKEKWTMSNFLLHYIDPLQDNQTTLTEIIIEDSTVYIGIIPLSLRKLQLKNCFLVHNSQNSVKRTPLPNHLEQLSFVDIFVERESGFQCTSFDISYLISPTLKTLQVKDNSDKCPRLRVSLLRLKSIKYLDLAKCAVVYSADVRISPTELTLTYVRIINENQRILFDVTVNQLVKLNEMECLHLNGMSIDFNDRVQLSELTLINTKVLNLEQGIWDVDKVRTFPNLGLTRMKFNQLESVKEPGNDDNISRVEIKKAKLLQFLKNISGLKTITGFSLCGYNTQKDLETIQGVTGVLPGILTTRIYSSEVMKLQSLVEDTISTWNNSYLVHIRLYPVVLNDILEDGSETSWIDLIEEGGKRNKLWKKELDTCACFLHQLQVAGIVPIFNLLPDINFKLITNHWTGRDGLNGSWRLLRMTKDYLTQHHGLTSLLWAWSLDVVGDMTRVKDFWPGDNYVDVAIVSMGNRKELRITEYQALLDVVGNKPIAMEDMWYIPSPELLAKQSRWTWFTVYNNFINNDDYNSRQNKKRTFNSSSVINRDSKQFPNNIFFT